MALVQWNIISYYIVLGADSMVGKIWTNAYDAIKIRADN